MTEYISTIARALCTFSFHDYRETGREPQTQFHRNVLEEECARCGSTRRIIVYWCGHEPSPADIRTHFY